MYGWVERVVEMVQECVKLCTYIYPYVLYDPRTALVALRRSITRTLPLCSSSHAMDVSDTFGECRRLRVSMTALARPH